MASYDVVERHQIDVLAPASVTLRAAREMDMGRVPLVRAIFRGRELIMGDGGHGGDEAPGGAAGNGRAEPGRPGGFVADMKAIGWGVLLDSERQLVMGGVTKPWQANPVFRALPPEEFAAFAEPDYVKIVFTLRADATGPDTSIFLTETRAVATDRGARDKFRWYWSFLSPGIILIRRALLRPLKAEAERLVQPSAAGSSATAAG